MLRRTCLIACLFTCVALPAGDWRQFRGNRVDGVADDANPPAVLSGDTIEWQQPLPGRGLSSPIVVGDAVYVSASSGAAQERLHVLCFDAASGELRWERQFWATGRTSSHEKTCNAAPTPCSDGERIYAFYSSNDVLCLELDGDFVWARGLTWDFPNASNSLGMSSSPVVMDGTLVAMVENDADSFTIGMDALSGSTRWKMARPRKANWTSPAILGGDQARVLLQSSAGLAAVDPASGEVAWTFAKGASTIPSLVVTGEVAYVPSNGVTALRAAPNVSEGNEVLWQEGSLTPGTASPVAYGGKLFFVNNAGVLTAASQETGERLWQERLTGPFSGSPVIADGRLYIVNEEGVIYCVDVTGEQPVVLSSFDLDQTVLCTPAIAGDALYLRSDATLIKLASPGGE
jgi:outer membrane protein assembly factor BamB